MKIKIYLFALLFLCFGARGKLQAQTSDSLICSYFHLHSGEVFVGKVIARTASEVALSEQLLGEVTLKVEDIKDETNLYRGNEVRVQTADEGKYFGRILDIDSTAYLIDLGGAEAVRIPKAQVTAFEIMAPTGEDVHNPNSTRYLFAPSAIPLKKGTGYYQNAYIIVNSANYGLTDHISIGGGVGIPIFFFLNPKIGTKVAKNLYVAGGAIAATTFIGENITLAIPFGAVTYGNEENNATLAAGYGLFWFDGDFEHSKYPIGTLNAMFRLSNRLHLVTENWGIPVQRSSYYYDPNIQDYVEMKSTDLYAAIAAGLRIKVGQVGSLDVAPVFLSVGGDPIVVPYIDFVYKF